MNDNERIPILQVIDDMYSDRGMISSSARDYFYTVYATPEQRKRMDAEDHRDTIIAFVTVGIIAALGVVSVVLSIVQHLGGSIV